MFKLSGTNHLNFAKVLEKTKQGISNLPPVKKRRKTYFLFAFLKYASLTILFIILALTLWLMLNFVNLKIIYQSALTGQDNLEYAVSLANNKQYDAAADFSEQAETNFSFAINQLNAYQDSYIISHLPIFNSQITDIVYLLSTAEMLSQAIKEAAQFGAGFGNILNAPGATFADLTKNEKRQVLKKAYESTPLLNGIKADIELAILNLYNVRMNIFLWPLAEKISALDKQLIVAKNILEEAIPMTEILPPILGYPDRTAWLFLLQNNDELRPTGGFIGTYGILEMEDSDIIRFDTHDIYHLDMPVKDKINVVPPPPLVKYLGVKKWYMRDANWSPDWPTAASKIEWFYRTEDKLLPPKDQINKFYGQFNGVIGITPQVIIDLLTFIGPIRIDNEEYNNNNFTKLLEYKVEKGYEILGIPAWHRKDVIGDIAKELQRKIVELPLDKLFAAVKIVSKNLAEKNIILFAHDIHLQELAKDYNWAGEIKNTASDYIMVVDANMASLKTDAVINRSFSYKISQDIDGVIANLEINYSHNGQIDWRTSKYRTYTRIYVPLGSQLIRAEGVTSGEATVHNELGKTVFSAFKEVEPGKIGALRFNYKLPAEINRQIASGAYQLYAQKQPGTKIENFNIDLKFMNDIKSYRPTGFYINKFNNTLRWETDLATDRSLSIVLE